MFPLGRTLFPGDVLPLHVFEPRYQALVQDCLAGTPEFGVVLIVRGSEVGGGDSRHGVGVRARIVQLAALGEGRYALVCVGTERFRVREWLTGNQYPVADVDVWEDAVTEVNLSGIEVDPLIARVRRLAALANELGDYEGDPLFELPDDCGSDSVRLSYALAGAAPLGPSDRQRLLECAGPASRLALLAQLLADAEPGLMFRLGEGPSPLDSPPAW